MRVRAFEQPVESLRPEPSARALATQLTVAHGVTASVELSRTVRALTAALEMPLPGPGAQLVQHVLLEQDRLLLAWAHELLTAQGGDPATIEQLALELAVYRAAGRQALPSSAPRALETRMLLSVATSADAPLALPIPSPEDEPLVRSMLVHVVTHESALDPAFVVRLLEPGADRGIDLRALHRLVLSLPVRRAESSPALDLLFAGRDARAALSSALSALDLPRERVTSAGPAQIALGTKRLAQQLIELALEQPSARPFATLTRNDRAVLVLLHAAEVLRGGEGDGIARFARALLTLRVVEREARSALRSAPTTPLAREAVDPRGPAAADPSRAAEAHTSTGPIEGDTPTLTAQPGKDGPPPTSSAEADHARAPQRADEARALPPPMDERTSDARASDARTSDARASEIAVAALCYGDRARLAARVATTYASLAPAPSETASVLHAALAAWGLRGASAADRRSLAEGAIVLTTPELDLTQALGLGALVAQLHRRALRARRARLRRRHGGAIEALRGVVRSRRRRDGASAHGDPSPAG